MSKIIIVDENDNVIGHKEFKEMKTEDIYRVSALWIENSDGFVLLTKRALTKEHDPGKWGPAVAGTLEERETYEQNVVKEAEEEIGLKETEFLKGPKVRIYGKHNFFCQWFILKTESKLSEFKIQKEEVDEIKWFSKETLLKEIELNPEKFLLNMKKYTELFIKAKEKP